MSVRQIIDTLKQYQNTTYFRNKYGIYMYSLPIFFNGVNVYKSEGIARRAILNHVFGKNTKESNNSKNKQNLENLIKTNIIQIKKL